MMGYYLRVEAVNLGSFVYDTDKLQVIRGGSIFLLDSTTEVQRKINNYYKDKENKDVVRIKELLNTFELKNDKTKSDNNKIKNLKKKIKKRENKISNIKEVVPITKGASWGLFKLNTDNREEATEILRTIRWYFKNDSAYKHTNIVTNLLEDTGKRGSYQTTRNKIQALNRWEQVHSPSLSIPSVGDSNRACEIDKFRPATQKRKNAKEESIFVSDSIHQRIEKGGTKQKTNFYKKITNLVLNYTQDLSTLSEHPEKGILQGKIAFIYIDGNEFGKNSRNAQTPEKQSEFDRITREWRDRMLGKILTSISSNESDSSWFYDNKKKQLKQIRMETLLWGGDEIIWVVPAWQGWWLLNQFYEEAKSLKYNNKPLYHGASIIFCKHNAPIHRIDRLARNLADNFSKKEKKKNLIAYQVLESFDHVGTNLYNFRKNRIKGLSSDINDLLIDARNLNDIEKSIRTLKDKEFPKRKIYQIVQCYRNNEASKAEELKIKITGKNNSKKDQSNEQKAYIKELNNLETLFGMSHENSNIFWLHLMELWDYVGLEKNNTTKNQQKTSEGE